MDESQVRVRGAQKQARKEARQRRNRRHNPDGQMNLVEHLYELRTRLGYAILALLGGAILAYIWYGVSVGPVPSLGQMMLRPYCSLPPNLRLNFGSGETQCALLQTQPFEGFTVRLKVAGTCGAALSSPIWFYQLWSFVTPALHRNERRYTITFVTCASLLFACGVVLAYMVLPQALLMLTQMGGEQFVGAFAGKAYFSFLIALLIVFGVSFELPLLVVMLNRIGVVRYEQLKAWRRGVIFGLFCLAAVATPGTDPFSMVALALALTVLFEVSVQISRVHDKRRDRKDALEELDLDDPQPTPLDQLATHADGGPQTSSGSSDRHEDAT